MSRARTGYWLIIPAQPGTQHERRGQILELLHPDGTPPYRVKWLDDEHVSVVFPPPDARVQEHLDERHTGA